MAPTRWKNVNAASKVQGRIRCHRCSVVCSDAAHYLSHKCGAPSLSPAVVRCVTATRRVNCTGS